jgi:hypothetical protein
VSLAELKALIAEAGDLNDMAIEYKHRLLAVMRRDHANAVRLIKELRDDVETGEEDHFELARTKRTVLAGLMTNEAELRVLIEWLAARIEEAAPEEPLRDI